MTTFDERLEEALGYRLDSLDPALRGSISDLNAFPARLIEDARRVLPLGGVATHRFIRHFAPREDNHDISGFIEDVVKGGAPAEAWGRRDHLCIVHPDLHTLIALPVEDAIERLGAVDDAELGWVRPPPDRARWSSDLPGAPGRVARRRHYKWTPPEGTRNYLLQETSRLEPIAGIAVAYRRWLASRLAWYWLEAKRRAVLPADPEIVLIEGRGPTPSRDARLAIRGLRRELDELGDPGDQVPGFRGPDAWYEE